MALQQYDVAAAEPLPSGRVEIRFELERTGDNQGRVKLLVNGAQVASGDLERTVPRAFGIIDSFDVGLDTGSPVTDHYVVPNAYAGRIEKLEVILTDGPVAPEVL
jgi:arylsulfatase